MKTAQSNLQKKRKKKEKKETYMIPLMSEYHEIK